MSFLHNGGVQDENSRHKYGKTGGKRELGAAEKWLFDIEDGEVRLATLLKMSTGQQGIAELEEFKTYGSDAEKSYGLDISLNRVFILGEMPLIARGREDRVVIRKPEAEKTELSLESSKRLTWKSTIRLIKEKWAPTISKL